MKCDFQVGDKVVCVDSIGILGDLNIGGLIEGQIYTITRIEPMESTNRTLQILNPTESECEVWIAEITRQSGCGFGNRRFRKLQTKSTETGMAILREILNTTKVTENV